MLATLTYSNIVRFLGGCCKPMVWCIVTEYVEGGSVRQFLTKRQNRTILLKLAIKQGKWRRTRRWGAADMELTEVETDAEPELEKVEAEVEVRWGWWRI